MIADDRVQIHHIQHLGFRAFPIQFHAGRAYGGLDHEPRSPLSRRRRLGEAARVPLLLVRQTRDGLRRGDNRESFACMAAVGAFATCNAFGQMVHRRQLGGRTELGEPRRVRGRVSGAVSEGPYEWRIEHLSFEGDTALIRLGGLFASIWYSDDLSLVLIDDAWRIVHKTFYAHPED